MSSPDRLSAAADPARRPRSRGQRLQLLCVLLVIPVAAVVLPTLVITYIFGQRPAAKASAHAAPAPDLSGLKDALNHSAETLFPTPRPLSSDTVILKVRADHVEARVKKVAAQAQSLGGAVVQGVAAAGEQAHLFVDLPPGRAESFREAITKNEPPVVPTGAASTPGSARDQLEVIIRAVADDE